MENTTETPKLFILPQDTSAETRIVTLSHPRTASPCRYLFCPEKGIYEFTKIAAPKAATRSLLLARTVRGLSGSGKHKGSASATNASPPSCGLDHEGPDDHHTATSNAHLDGKGARIDLSKGYITESNDLYVATPMDPLFLVLPALRPSTTKASPSSSKGEEKKRLFLSADDYLDSLAASSKHFAHVTRTSAFRRLVERRLAAVCDSVEAGDEKMHRFSLEKFCQEMLRKAGCMVLNGLPASLEERFVTRALEVPFTALKREESAFSVTAASQVDDGHQADSSITTDSDTIIPTSTPHAEPSLSRTISTVSSDASQTTSMTTITAATSAPSESTPAASCPSATDEIIQLLRLRTALTYLCTNYLPAHLSDDLTDLLSTSMEPSSCTSSSTQPSFSKPIDFRPLYKHLDELRSLREEALSAQSLSHLASRKRPFRDDDYDDLGAGSDNETRRKRLKAVEDENKKKAKAGTSRAVRDLKKTDVSGMKKLSSFFGGGGGGAGAGARKPKT